MASKASGVTLDTIVIDIESNASSAVNGVEALAASLVKLKQSMNKGFGNLKKLAAYLNDLKIAADGLDKVADNLSSVTQITTALSTLSQIGDPKGLKNAVNSLKDLPGVFDNISPTTLQNVATVSNALTQSLRPLADVMGIVAQGYNVMETLANKYGMTLTKIKEKTNDNKKETNSLASALKKLPTVMKSMNKEVDKFGKDSINVFKKVGSKIKQIGLSLLGTRSIFTATRKAISEYMQMDQELTKATQNLWRALGAQLAPAIEYVLFLFKHIVRVIYSVVYALTGIDLIARANAKALASMGKAAKDALGSLQKFDDLNVAEFDKGSGGEIPQIELDKIDLTPIQEVIDWMKKLKAEIENAWKTGEWGGVLNVLLDGFIGLIDSIPWYKIGDKAREAIESVDWKTVWDKVCKIAKESFYGLAEFINGLFGQEEDSPFGANLINTFIGIYGIIQLIKGADGLLGILDTLGLIEKAPALLKFSTLLAGISVIVLSIKGILDSWSEFLENPSWETGWNTFYDTLLGIVGIVTIIGFAIGGWPVALIGAITMGIILFAKFLNENLDAINQWAYDLGKKIGDWFEKQWKKIKKWWGGVKKDAKNAATSLGNTMGNALKGGIEWALNKIIDGFNWIKKQLNKFSFDVPEWVPGIGGGKWGFDLKMSDHVKLETGTNEIEYEGLYHLHEGEAVVPKKYNPALGNGGTDEEVGQKLDTLITMIGNMNFTNIVNVGNETLYKRQQRYNAMQNDKYGTTVNL